MLRKREIFLGRDMEEEKAAIKKKTPVASGPAGGKEKLMVDIEL